MNPAGQNTVAGNLEAWITLEGMQRFVGDLKTGMNRARSEMTKVSRDVKRLGLVITGVSTMAVKMASDVAAGVSEISTLADYTDEELSEIEKGLRKTRIETGQSFKALQKARYDIISAGFVKVGESQKFVEASAKAAVAGVAEVNETASVGLSVLQNYAMAVDQIDHIYDVMQTIIRRGRTRMSEITPYMAEIVQFGRTARVEFEDLGALIATTTIGMGGQTAKAMTALKGALRGLAAPAPEAEKWFKKLNIQVKYLSDGSMDVLNTFRQFQGMDLATIRKLIPDVEAAAGVLAVANNLDKLESDLAAFQHTSGEYMKAWEKRAESFDIKWSQLIANIHDKLITIGMVLMPEVEKGVERLGSRMDDLLPQIKSLAEMVGNMVGWVVEHGDLLGQIFKVAVIAKISTMLYRTGGALYYVASGIKAIAAAKYLNPVTAGLAAIAAGAVVVASAIQKYRQEQENLNDVNVEFSTEVQNAKKETGKLVADFDRMTNRLLVLAQKENLSNEELLIKKDTIAELQSKFPNYFKNLEDNAGKYDDLKEAISAARIELDRYTDNVVRSAVLQVYSNRIGETAARIIDLKTEILRLKNNNESLRNSLATTKEEQDANTQAVFNNNFAIEAANILIAKEEEKLEQLREGYALAAEEAEKYAATITRPSPAPAPAPAPAGAPPESTGIDIQRQIAEIEFNARLAEITAEGELERLNIRKQAVEEQLDMLDENNEDQIAKWRDLQIELAQVNRDITEAEKRETEIRMQIQREYVDFVVNAMMDIGYAIGAGLSDARRGWKEILKSILVTTITAIEQFAILAKIQNAIRMQFQGGIFNPKAWVDFLGNNAFLLAQLAGLEAAKGAIMALAEGARVTSPTLALLAEAGPEIVAPEGNFLDWAESLRNEGSREQVEEIKNLRSDVQELNRSIKKISVVTEVNDKSIRKIMKYVDSKEKRNKLS